MKPKTSVLNKLKTVRTLVALSLATLVTAAAFAEGLVRYEAVPNGNKCTITGRSGDSILSHDWTMDSKIISGFIEADEKFPESALTDAAAAKPKTSVSIPVRSFKSGKSAMDDKMQIMMNATKFPKIEYRLIELKAKSKAGGSAPLDFEAVGALTIAGKTLTNTMPVTIEKKATNLQIKGSAPIAMTDYGIKPEVTVAGISISVKNEVKIEFDWRLAKKAQPEPAK